MMSKHGRFKKRVWMPLGLAALIALWSLWSDRGEQHRPLAEAEVAFTQVYVTSRDPDRLASFYTEVFGAQAYRPSGPLPNPLNPASAQETHLRTPGYAGQGPTLTLWKVAEPTGRGPLLANDAGYAHICFESNDVATVARRIVAAGGTLLSTYDDVHKKPALYAQDPEGNVVEVHIPLPSPITPGSVLRALDALTRSVLARAPLAQPSTRFLHVNINTRDWARTAAFYEQVFGTALTGLQRDYDGAFIENLTGVAGAKVQGRHAALPGYSTGGPTLEIFTYQAMPHPTPLGPGDVGRVAIGFSVRDVDAVARRLTAAGGVVLQRDAHSLLARDLDGDLILVRAR
jgi:predicted enzyme related to lactoylglutathione lyase